MWFSQKQCMPIAGDEQSIFFLNVCRIDSKEGWYYPLHAHEWFEIVFCTKGSGTVTIHATTFTLKAGSALLVHPNTFHSFYGDGTSDFEYCVLGFFTEAGSKISEELLHSTAVLADISKEIPCISATYDVIYDAYMDGTYLNDPLLFTSCLELLHLLLYKLKKNALDMPLVKNSVTDRILNYVHDHYREDISLEALSKSFSISVPHLCRLFKNAYNTSIISYLIDYRFCVAKDYLSNSQLTVQDISRLVGYEDAGHFCKLFEKRIGYSPADYRKLRFTTRPSTELPLNLIRNFDTSFPGE